MFYCRWVYLGEGKPVKIMGPSYSAPLCCRDVHWRVERTCMTYIWILILVINMIVLTTIHKTWTACSWSIILSNSPCYPKSIPSSVTELLNNHPGVQSMQLFKKWWFRNEEMQILGCRSQAVFLNTFKFSVIWWKQSHLQTTLFHSGGISILTTTCMT